MAARLTESALYAHLWGAADVRARLEERARLQSWLDILVALPQEEFDAFENGSSVPQSLEFGHRGLTLQAVTIAREKLEAAQRARTRR